MSHLVRDCRPAQRRGGHLQLSAFVCYFLLTQLPPETQADELLFTYILTCPTAMWGGPLYQVRMHLPHMYKTSFIVWWDENKGKQPAKNVSTELVSHHKENNFGSFFVRWRQCWTTVCLISVGVTPDEMCTLVSAELHTMSEGRSWGLAAVNEINDKSFAVGNTPSDVLHSKNHIQCLRMLHHQFDGTLVTDSFSLQALT